MIEAFFYRAGPAPALAGAQREKVMLKSALLVTAGIVLGAGAISRSQAQSNAPYYMVAEINVKDQAAYEASGVHKVRNLILQYHGGKLIAGGYNKTETYDGAPPPNRFLIFQYVDKAASDKAWNESVKDWQTSDKVRKLAEFRTWGVEGIHTK
jgi:uncharacterized protein (DUF1330 family)